MPTYSQLPIKSRGTYSVTSLISGKLGLPFWFRRASNMRLCNGVSGRQAESRFLFAPPIRDWK